VRPFLAIASDLERRADIRRGDAIAPLLLEAMQAIRELVRRLDLKPRSTPQHRRYFALIRAAHKQWPEGHPIQPATEEGLRDYLQVMAGFGIPHRIEKGGETYIWLEHKSVSYNKMGHNEFTVLSGRVEDEIVRIIGVPADKLLEMDRNET